MKFLILTLIANGPDPVTSHDPSPNAASVLRADARPVEREDREPVAP